MFTFAFCALYYANVAMNQHFEQYHTCELSNSSEKVISHNLRVFPDGYVYMENNS